MNLDEASLGQDFGAGGDRADDIVAVLAIGICIGGRLSVRAALNPDVSAGPCFCASDIQNRCLGQGMKDDSLDRVGDRGELLIISGRQDQHIPREGRERIQAMDEDAVTRLSWVKVNGHPLASERPAVTTEPATGEADGSE
jgi:dienelactone hydrolase